MLVHALCLVIIIIHYYAKPTHTGSRINSAKQPQRLVTETTTTQEPPHDSCRRLCEKRRPSCVVSRPSAAAPVSSSASSPPARDDQVSPGSACLAADSISASAACNRNERHTLASRINCTDLVHDGSNETSGYATWFTAGGAIRIAHYDVVTRKL